MSKAYSQKEHERINAREYPGTRQMCCFCGEPTGRCEDDSINIDDYVFDWAKRELVFSKDDYTGPMCEECYEVWRKF
jgi:hypothetical protein